MSHNNDTIRELLPNNIDLFRTHIKQYSHFHGVITRQLYKKHFFESLNGHLNR